MGGKQSRERSNAQPQKKGSPSRSNAPPPAAGGRITTTDEAVLSLKEQRDDLARAARRSRKVAKKLDTEAKKCLRADDRQTAMRCVKRKRLYEERLKRIAAMQDNVEEMLNAVETAQFEAQVASTLKEGGAALEALVREMGDVEKAMDQAADAVADAQAISDLLGQTVGAPGTAGAIDLDDAELEEELAALVAQDSTVATKTPASKTPELPTMPAVPTHEIKPDATVAPEDANVAASEPTRQLAAA